MITQITSKNINNTWCEKCDFKCSKLGDWKRHILTSKHIHNNEMITQITSNTSFTSTPSTINYGVQSLFATLTPPDIVYGSLKTSKKYNCSCGKEYKYQSGLCCHKKKCSVNIQPTTKECENAAEEDDELHNNSHLILEILKQNQEFKELILEKPVTDTNDSLIIELLKQNQDFKNLMIEQNKYMMEQSKQMMELAKNAGTNNSHNTTNNKFNMQIFLNETCKDAMSITEFVNSLVLTFKDLEDLGRYGYTQGITNIFTRGLQATEISKRPIHCSDMKRLIIYINDINGWEKDNSSQEKVIQLIRKIAGKNLRQATEWMRINHSMIHGPDSYEQRQYLKMISQWFGGTDEENLKNYNKIIRNIAPQCYIDKYPALN